MKVLVYGWYHQGNIGDDLFIDAFKHLFPKLDLTFAENINEKRLKDIDAIFFGGGSFLFGQPVITPAALEIIKQKKIFYIGVGVEAEIHPIHLDLMKRAQLLAIRTSDQLERVKSINSNTMLIPDLVYSLSELVVPKTIDDKSVLVIPNVYVVPQHSDPNWKHAAWTYFKSEFCQFLDYLVENKYRPHLFAMCTAHKEDDRWASSDLISFMQHRSNGYLLQSKLEGIKQISQLISKHSMVITQRYHGIVLAEICRTPYIAIHHHDKLKKQPQNEAEFISYYGLSKQNMIEAFNRSLSHNNHSILPIETDIFEALVNRVTSLL